MFLWAPNDLTLHWLKLMVVRWVFSIAIKLYNGGQMSLLYVNTNILIKLINTFNEYDFYNMMKNNIILYFINIIINIIY